MPLHRRRSAAFLFVAIWLVHAPVATSAGPEDLDARLRLLEKKIAATRGLAFKNPVVAKVIPRSTGSSKTIQGFYSIKDKTLFLYEDVKNTYQEGVLIHEMVHALQDQHFDLARLKSGLHREGYDSDADLALAALIEGDATFTMIEVLKTDQPKVAGMLDVPIEKAKNLHNAFLYSQGARYVKAVKDRGGWAGVNFAYRFPPGNTATIFNLRSISSIDLGPGPSRGAYALFKELAEDPATREVALRVAQGWRGDRVIKRSEASAGVIACVDAKTATLLQSALAHRDGSGLQAVKEEPFTWKKADGAMRAVLVRGKRGYRVEASSELAFRAIVDEVEGPLNLFIFATKEKTHISFGEMIERLLTADLVCVGESHGSDLQHRVQYQIIKGLYAQDERLGVGMEMFQRPFQKAVDRYVAGETTEDEFLESSEYHKRWGYEWSLYRPIVDFCQRNRVPLAALNAPKELTGRISKVGFAGLSAEEKKQLGHVDFLLKEHRDYWYERLANLHGSAKKKTPEEKQRSYEVMTVWDDYMAASAALFQRERKLRRLVILAGSGHIERGFGIPLRVSRRTGGKALTIRIEVGSRSDTEEVTDFVVVVQ